MVQLGDTVKDTISGFSGMATGISRFLNGCVRVLVEPKKLTKDGTLLDSKWFDEPQLKVTATSKLKPAKPAHGPRPDCPRR